MNTEPILIVNDDADDKEFFEEAWKELNFSNELIFFTDPFEAITFLKEKRVIPFLIISEVKMSKMDGFEFKKKLLEDTTLNYKSIPFVYFSNTATNTQIKKSYDLGSNGFFIKGNNLEEIKNNLADIVHYWQKSKAPE